MRQLNQVVQLSGRARRTTETAVTGARDCQIRPADAIAMMNQAIANRQAAIGQLKSATTRDIPDGAAMLADLRQALSDSIAADQAYSGWMQEMVTGGSCPVSTANDLSYQAGDHESNAAVAVKKHFVARWNALAGQFGLPVYTDNDL